MLTSSRKNWGKRAIWKRVPIYKLRFEEVSKSRYPSVIYARWRDFTSSLLTIECGSSRSHVNASLSINTRNIYPTNERFILGGIVVSQPYDLFTVYNLWCDDSFPKKELFESGKRYLGGSGLVMYQVDFWPEMLLFFFCHDRNSLQSSLPWVYCRQGQPCNVLQWKE